MDRLPWCIPSELCTATTLQPPLCNHHTLPPVQIGEVLDGRYEVTEFKGKGVFSNVMRARDLGAGRVAGGIGGGIGVAEVAIKVIRANETMYKAALTEQAILRKLSSSDPDNRKHCIRMLRSFEFRKHMCLVFEAMVSGLAGCCNWLTEPTQAALALTYDVRLCCMRLRVCTCIYCAV